MTPSRHGSEGQDGQPAMVLSPYDIQSAEGNVSDNEENKTTPKSRK